MLALPFYLGVRCYAVGQKLVMECDAGSHAKKSGALRRELRVAEEAQASAQDWKTYSSHVWLGEFCDKLPSKQSEAIRTRIDGDGVYQQPTRMLCGLAESAKVFPRGKVEVVVSCVAVLTRVGADQKTNRSRMGVSKR